MATRRTSGQPAGGTQSRLHGKRLRVSAPALLELRSYAMAPGQRDVLNEMFEKHFLDAYVAAGASILGVFSNADDPDRWIWIRAFPNPAARAKALEGFYESAAWLSRRASANRTIRSSRDAILLKRHAGDLEGLQVPPLSRARRPSSLIECTRYFLKRGEDEGEVLGFIQAKALPLLKRLGAAPCLLLSRADVPNLYPRAPLRQSPVVVSLLRFSSIDAHRRHLLARKASREWAAVELEFASRLKGPPESWRLQPMRRSALR